MRLLVVGVGSIGLRHIRNLQRIGVSGVLAYDVDPLRLELAVKLGAVACPTLEAGLSAQPEGALICTPPDDHLGTARQALEHGAHVFIEKPIAPAIDGVEALLALATAVGRTIVVGYNLRFHPGLLRLKTLLDEGRIGRLLTLRAEFGQYLPDWRPDQDYRRGYIAKAGSGGVVLDVSHELDYVRWLAGEPVQAAAMMDKLGDLHMFAEDTALVLLRFNSGTIGHIYLDCLQHAYSRGCKLIGTTGTLVWDFESGVRLFTAARSKWEEFAIAVDANDMYVDEMRHWLACIAGEATPVVSGWDAARTLRLALAVLEAAQAGREVAV